MRRTLNGRVVLGGEPEDLRRGGALLSGELSQGHRAIGYIFPAAEWAAWCSSSPPGIYSEELPREVKVGVRLTLGRHDRVSALPGADNQPRICGYGVLHVISQVSGGKAIGPRP
jgi:hypothetical protein